VKTRHSIRVGDALDMISIPDDSIDLIVTSPPYFGQRIYLDGVGNPITHAVGSEATPAEYLDALASFMTEAWRVIKPIGSVFVNLGDKYAGSGGHNNDRIQGTKYDPEIPTRDGPSRYVKVTEVRRKSLIGLPWRFALQAMDAGWILRQELIWDKPNGMPESVTDRTRRTHEQWFHFTKNEMYFAAVDELREPHQEVSEKRAKRGQGEDWAKNRHPPDQPPQGWTPETALHALGKLPSSVQRISTGGIRPTAEEKAKFGLPDHFAPYPAEWPRFFILGWSPVGGLILDPFAGTGTTSLVAKILDRSSISIDISPAYVKLMNWRLYVSDHEKKLTVKWRKRGLL